VSLADQMLQTIPSGLGFDRERLAECVAACFDCAQACTACADACLGEDMVTDLRHCITLDLNCADVCGATGRILSRQTSYDADLSMKTLEACHDACRRCADECEQHAQMHAHCGVCAAACRRCAQACEALLNS
jgi:hypothetical protein